mgnify:CR=1 FL=1
MEEVLPDEEVLRWAGADGGWVGPGVGYSRLLGEGGGSGRGDVGCCATGHYDLALGRW